MLLAIAGGCSSYLLHYISPSSAHRFQFPFAEAAATEQVVKLQSLLSLPCSVPCCALPQMQQELQSVESMVLLNGLHTAKRDRQHTSVSARN